MKQIIAATMMVFSLSIHAQLVPKDAVPEKVADGYKFTEGPALGPDGCIYFTDIPAELILKFDPTSGETVTFRENTGKANGLLWNLENLYMCCHGSRSVSYYLLNQRAIDHLDGLPTDKEQHAAAIERHKQTPIPIINKFMQKQANGTTKEIRFNSPNDLTIDSDANIYFTDPRYGNRDNMETTVEGVYFHGNGVREENGEKVVYTYIACIDADLVRPNGIVLSPDESILYVADNGANYIYAYDIEEPGKVKNKRVFGRINDGRGGGSDGMCVDQQGRLYATGHKKVWVFEPTGELVATIDVGPQTTNVTFGADGKTLYITANKGLYRIKLDTDAPLKHAEKE